MGNKTIVRKSAFLNLHSNSGLDSRIKPGIAHVSITKDKVYYALFGQSASKAISHNKMNF